MPFLYNKKHFAEKVEQGNVLSCSAFVCVVELVAISAVDGLPYPADILLKQRACGMPIREYTLNMIIKGSKRKIDAPTETAGYYGGTTHVLKLDKNYWH